jgi:hypothetical protein
MRIGFDKLMAKFYELADCPRRVSLLFYNPIKYILFLSIKR